MTCPRCQAAEPRRRAVLRGVRRTPRARLRAVRRRDCAWEASSARLRDRTVAVRARRPPRRARANYTPKHLAEKILTSKAALEGERKQVTVLFADLKGSMELLADRDPEEARKLLDPVLERMMEAVHRYEGTVNQVMGDGIMALFGAPLAHEDHAVRACYAALRMQESRRAVRGGESCARTGSPIQIRVGPELGRGGRPRHRQRPAHGLHGGRPDDAPGRPHGADGHARLDPARARDPAAGRGLRPGQAAGARSPVQGPAGPRWRSTS